MLCWRKTVRGTRKFATLFWLQQRNSKDGVSELVKNINVIDIEDSKIRISKPHITNLNDVNLFSTKERLVKENNEIEDMKKLLES